jgi:hypothetical protein
MNLRIPWMVWLAVAPACNVINPGLLGGDAAFGPQDSAVDASSDMPEPGLILRYTFEDTGATVHDVSGRHKDAMVNDPSVWTTSGRLGSALGLKGTQYVSLPSGILEGIDDFTITTWVKMTTVSDWARIYDFGNATGDQFMYLTLSGYEPGPNPPPVPPPPPVYDGVHLSSFGGSATSENWFGTKTHFPTSVWKHVAVTGTGGDRRLYIDGFPAASRIGGPSVPPRQMEPMSPNSWLGKSHFADPNLNGTLDDFRIYSRVLTATEIQDLAWPQHDYSYWRFDETSGTSAKDSSDNALAGTLSAGLAWVTGRLGGAVKLPGAVSGATGPHISFDTSPLAACSEFTVAVWVKLDALDSSRIFDFGTGTTSYIYLAVTDGVGIHFGMAAPGKPAFDLATPTQLLSVDGQWHHVAVTLLSGTATIYFDGLSKASMGGTTIKPTDLGATTQNWLGQSRAGDRYLSGSLDELRIACRAFTPDEIINLSRP